MAAFDWLGRSSIWSVVENDWLGRSSIWSVVENDWLGRSSIWSVVEKIDQVDQVDKIDQANRAAPMARERLSRLNRPNRPSQSCRADGAGLHWASAAAAVRVAGASPEQFACFLAEPAAHGTSAFWAERFPGLRCLRFPVSNMQPCRSQLLPQSAIFREIGTEPLQLLLNHQHCAPYQHNQAIGASD